MRLETLNPWMAGIHIFVGIGGAAGGLAAITNPVSPLGVSTDMLKNGPFTDYFIPGLVLFCVIGLGNMFAAYAVLKKIKYHEILSGILGALLAGWILIQCLILLAVGALHVIFFFIGAIQCLLSFVLLYQKNLFPASLLIKWIKRKN